MIDIKFLITRPKRIQGDEKREKESQTRAYLQISPNSQWQLVRRIGILSLRLKQCWSRAGREKRRTLWSCLHKLVINMFDKTQQSARFSAKEIVQFQPLEKNWSTKRNENAFIFVLFFKQNTLKPNQPKNVDPNRNGPWLSFFRSFCVSKNSAEALHCLEFRQYVQSSFAILSWECI